MINGFRGAKRVGGGAAGGRLGAGAGAIGPQWDRALRPQLGLQLALRLGLRFGSLLYAFGRRPAELQVASPRDRVIWLIAYDLTDEKKRRRQ